MHQPGLTGQRREGKAKCVDAVRYVCPQCPLIMGTIRQQIIDLLAKENMSALDISRAVGVSEKDVYRHLAHIGKTVAAQGRKLTHTPSSCRACGFTFRQRQRLTRPGHCPRCRQSRIDPPLFRIEE